MVDKFKAFLAAAPHWLDEDWQETWAYRIAVILPSILRSWYDPDFSDVWSKDGAYYETARAKLSRLVAFRRFCDCHDEVLRALELLGKFFTRQDTL